jgi:hypothetical protein
MLLYLGGGSVLELHDLGITPLNRDGGSIVHIDLCKSQTSLTLTKFIKKNVDIYNIECMPYYNILHDKSNGIDFII